jgi:elongator complex protein 6
VVSLRLLDSGIARDVSGVLRVTNGGGGDGTGVEEGEFLYWVGGDGGLRVWQR